jgi:hypothetical protein
MTRTAAIRSAARTERRAGEQHSVLLHGGESAARLAPTAYVGRNRLLHGYPSLLFSFPSRTTRFAVLLLTSAHPPRSVRIAARGSSQTTGQLRRTSHATLAQRSRGACTTLTVKPARVQELKTNKMLTTERDRTSFERYKLLKFWSQSFLAGVPRVVVGFRDDESIGTLRHHFWPPPVEVSPSSPRSPYRVRSCIVQCEPCSTSRRSSCPALSRGSATCGYRPLPLFL